jgi:hypothetical protein
MISVYMYEKKSLCIHESVCSMLVDSYFHVRRAPLHGISPKTFWEGERNTLPYHVRLRSSRGRRRVQTDTVGMRHRSPATLIPEIEAAVGKQQNWRALIKTLGSCSTLSTKVGCSMVVSAASGDHCCAVKVLTGSSGRLSHFEHLHKQ